LRALRGAALPRLNRDALGAHFILDTMIHQFVEGGRLALLPFAALALRRPQRDDARLATAAGLVALPLLFPAPLPRYMLAGLPWLGALAALGLMPLRRRLPWLAVI